LCSFAVELLILAWRLVYSAVYSSQPLIMSDEQLLPGTKRLYDDQGQALSRHSE
jgi:hypothetical protein